MKKKGKGQQYHHHYIKPFGTNIILGGSGTENLGKKKKRFKKKILVGKYIKLYGNKYTPGIISQTETRGRVDPAFLRPEVAGSLKFKW